MGFRLWDSVCAVGFRLWVQGMSSNLRVVCRSVDSDWPTCRHPAERTCQKFDLCEGISAEVALEFNDFTARLAAFCAYLNVAGMGFTRTREVPWL